MYILSPLKFLHQQLLYGPAQAPARSIVGAGFIIIIINFKKVVPIIFVQRDRKRIIGTGLALQRPAKIRIADGKVGNDQQFVAPFLFPHLAGHISNDWIGSSLL